ncbi:MAG: PLP-dependent aminotransferase family protein [Bacteroidales bacterium]|nr:PLP-dependent aminotransferase family protein [Bacteroidales bacterium]
MPTAPITFSVQSQRTGDSPISALIQQALSTPGLISFAAGLVDEPSLPVTETRDAAAALLSDPRTARAALQYGSTPGYRPLREKVLNLVCTADGITPEAIATTADEVLLTSGSQQLLYLLGEALCNPGDIVITEAPSYFVYHGVLASQGVRVLTVPMDAGGLDLTALEELLLRLEHTGELRKVRLIYTVDYFQNPTGLTLAAERRPQLLALAQRFSTDHRILILEDAAYRELRYGTEDLPSIKRYDTRNAFVIYTSTFSKPCAPGFRTGYALVPRELMQPLCNLKSNHDFGSSNLTQHLLDHLVGSGVYARQAEKVRAVYRKKKDCIVQALEQEFADWPAVQWTNPTGGFYVWLTLPPHLNAGPSGELVKRAVEQGVIYVPGAFAHVPDTFGETVRNNEIRLCFGIATEEQISEGIRRLRAACRGLEQPQAHAKPRECVTT